ncbi:MAG: hypothetical protein ABIR59_01555 [Gemmatimonadales bacterium]
MPNTTVFPRVALVAALLIGACRDFEPDPTGPITPPPPPPVGSATPFRIGSTGADYARNVVTDVVGNGYVASYYSGSVDFDPTSGTTIRASLGGNDIAVAKYAPNGPLVWAVSLGGAVNDQPFDMALAADGGVYVVGFAGAGLTCGGAPVVNNGGRDILLARISPIGTCQWARSIGGPQDDEGRGIAVRLDGSVAIVGLFRGIADFDPSAGSAALTSRGGVDGFIATYTSAGDFVAVSQMGGTGDDVLVTVRTAPAGDVVVGGDFRGLATLGTSVLSAPVVSAGESDFVVARYDAQLDLKWALRGGGTQADQVGALVIEGTGSIVVVGGFAGVADVGTGGAVPLASAGGQDVFIVRYDSDGRWQGLARRLGGSGSEGAQAVALDASGNILVSGWFQGTVDFDPGPNVTALTGLGTAAAGDAFLVSLDAGANLRWVAPVGAVVAGDANFALGSGVSVDADGVVWWVGRFFGVVDLDPRAGSVTVQSGGDADQFVIRLNAATGSLAP